MADISSLGNLQSAEPLDLDLYTDVKVGGTLPTKGRYTVQAPESFPATAFGATQAGFLSAQVDPTIVGPTNEGYKIRFTKVSAKPFQRSGKLVSQLGDYLRACGRRSIVGGDPQAQADAVEQTANTTYEVYADWRAYSKATGKVIEGMENFPKDTKTGKHQPWIEDADQLGEDGNPIRLRANLVVTRFLPVNA